MRVDSCVAGDDIPNGAIGRPFNNMRRGWCAGGSTDCQEIVIVLRLAMLGGMRSQNLNLQGRAGRGQAGVAVEPKLARLPWGAGSRLNGAAGLAASIAGEPT